MNDELVAYLAHGNIAWGPGDWALCQEGDSATATICAWNAAKLGAEPTADQLASMDGYIANQRQAAQFGAVLAAGMTVKCSASAITCTSAIEGTYVIDDNAQLKIAAAQLSIYGGQGLPGGGSTFLYKDINGTGHAFTAAQFSEFAVKARDFYYAASVAEALLQAGQSASWPAATVELE